MSVHCCLFAPSLKLTRKADWVKTIPSSWALSCSYLFHCEYKPYDSFPWQLPASPVPSMFLSIPIILEPQNSCSHLVYSSRDNSRMLLVSAPSSFILCIHFHTSGTFSFFCGHISIFYCMAFISTELESPWLVFTMDTCMHHQTGVNQILLWYIVFINVGLNNMPMQIFLWPELTPREISEYFIHSVFFVEANSVWK